MHRIYYLLALLAFVVFGITGCEKQKDRSLPVDADGNVYDTVPIGDQVWLKENLKTTTFIDGTPIPLLTDDNEWSITSSGANCWYSNDPGTNKDKYGALYNWYSVESGLLCPVGWHVPTHEEWTVLIDYLTGEFLAGSKMKEVGTVHWSIPNLDANNISVFTALPGGERNKSGTFEFMNHYCLFWSSTELNSTESYSISLSYLDSHVLVHDKK